MSSLPASSPDPAKGPLRVAILHKRYMPLDEQVLRALESHLTSSGCEVFADKQGKAGMEWAKEVETRIKNADAVIPILSPGAAHSEMIAYEVELAHEAAQRGGGRPMLLPVRVHNPGPLPEILGWALDPLPQYTWNGPQDNQRLLTDLLKSLQSARRPAAVPPDKRTPLRLRPRMAVSENPPAQSMNQARGAAPGSLQLEPIGGAVPLNSEFYIARPQDADLRTSIGRFDSIVLIKGARQMGKTSLLARGLQHGRERGAKVVLTDFQKLNVSDLESPTNFYLTLAEALAEQLDISVLPQDVWEDRRSPNVNFERYVRREVLGALNAPLVWGLDEVDRLFTCSFGTEVFGLFRSWHNERALDPSGPWAGLTLAIVYATEAHLFITDMNQSPFNVGTRLALEDFTKEQVDELNRRYGSPLKDGDALNRFYDLLGGHPFLARRALHEMATQRLDIAALEAQADQDEGIFGDHLRRMLMVLARDPALTDVVRGILAGEPCPTPESFYRLRSAGLVTGSSPADARPRCRLYSIYLKRRLL